MEGTIGSDVNKLSHKEQQDLHDEIIKLLENANCTVQQADTILVRVFRTIKGTATVQFVDGISYEF